MSHNLKEKNNCYFENKQKNQYTQEILKYPQTSMGISCG